MRNLKFILLLLISNSLFAQHKSEADTTKFKLQFDYLSNYTYNGRADSIKSPYLTPSVSYTFSNGIYISAAANYLLTKGQSGFDYFELDLGYDYTLGKKITGEVYATKYFYGANSNLISGNISSDIGALLTYDVGFVQFNNTMDVYFSNTADFQYTFGFEKLLEFKNSSNKFSISPAINSTVSTQNYYESVVNRKLNNNKGVKARQANLLIPTSTITTVVNNKGFKMLDIEVSIPINYENNNWGLFLTPTYAIPYNPASTTTTENTNGVTTIINSTPYSERKLNNIFYVQAGVFFKF